MSSLADFTFEIRLSGSTWTDITDYVISARWQLGFTGPLELVARESTLSLTLKNSDKRFSPEYSSGPYYPNLTKNKSIRIKATWQTVTYQLYAGQIQTIQPQPNTKAQRQTVIQCAGLFLRAQHTEAVLPIQENKKANEVIAALLSNAGLTANVEDVWLLGQASYSELGQTTELGDEDDTLAAEEGIATITIIGDEWHNASVMAALTDTVGREYGRLFMSRDGLVTFWNRHHLHQHPTADWVMPQTAIQFSNYSYGDILFNDVTVAARPRVIGTSYQVLAVHRGSVKVKAGASKVVSFRYESDTDGVKTGGKDVQTPLAATDYTANTEKDGSGTDVTSLMTASITETSSTRCRVQFTNNGVEDAYVLAGAELRGIRITDFGRVESIATDSASITSHGTMRYVYPTTLDDVDVAEVMADAIVQEYKNPQGLFRSIGFLANADSTRMMKALELGIGSRLTISEDQTGLSGVDYFIIGETWQLQAKSCRVSWALKEAAPDYWLLGQAGYSEIGQTTDLGPF